MREDCILKCIELRKGKSGIYNYFFEILGDNLDISDNSDYIIKIDKKTYCFDLQYAIFEILEQDSFEYIDEIFKQVKNDGYINKEKWASYIDKNLYDTYDDDDEGIIDKEYKPNIYIPIYNIKTKTRNNLRKDITYIHLPLQKENYLLNKSGRRKDNRVDFISDKENLLNFYNLMLNKNNYKDFEEIGIYEANFSDDDELIHAFLTIIFDLKVRFILKKCQTCKKYFFSTTGYVKNCSRIYKNGKTCTEINYKKKKYEKNNEFNELDKEIEKLKNRVKSVAYKHDIDEYDDYINLRDEKENKLSKRDFVEWLISHYKDKELVDSLTIKFNDLFEKYGVK